MSLQVWLPLNGNLKNQGLADVTVTNNGATVDNSGKIGKCYSFNPENSQSGTNYLTLNKKSSDIFQSGQSFSLSAWIKITGSFYSNGCGIVSCSEYKKNGFAFVLKSNKKLGIQLCFGDSELEWSVNMNALAENTWYHVCFTYEQTGKKLSVFVNGVIVDNKTETRDWQVHTTYSILIGKGTQGGWGYTFPGLMNDVRIYDHCLSPKEVKEISQGLVLHYPLNDVSALMSKCSNITWNQLIENGNFATDPTNAQGWYLGYGSSFNNTNPDYITYGGNNYSYYLKDQLVSGHKYYLYCRFKKSDISVSATPYIYLTNFDGGATNPANSDGSWTVYQKIKTSTGDGQVANYGIIRFVTNGASLDIDKKNGIQCIDLTQMFGSGNEPTLEEFKLMFPLPYYPYDAGTVKNLKLPMYDCSGYNNDGTIGGSLSIANYSPRYSKSTIFSSNSFITTGSATIGKISDQITVSIWGNRSSWTGDWRLISCTQNGGWTFYPVSNYLSLYIYVNGSYINVQGPQLSTITSGWHHFAGTFDGTIAKLYVDGVLINSVSRTGTIQYYASNSIFIGAEAGTDTTTPAGSYFNGSLSDVRIYATALTSDDIKDLYGTSAYIDNGQNLHCFEFVEDDVTSPEIEKTGIVKTQEFNEFPDDIVLYDYIQNDTNSWIDIGAKPTPNTNFEMDISWNALTPEDVFFGCSEASSYNAGNNFSMDKLNSKKIFYAFKQTGTQTNTTIIANTIYHFKLFGNTLTINDDTYTITRASTQPNLNIYLFARNIANISNPSSDNYTNKCIKKLYGFKLYDNDILIRDMIPCTKNGVAGLWDRVNNQFYGNAGTGTFTLGNPIQTVTSLYQDKINTKQLIEQ